MLVVGVPVINQREDYHMQFLGSCRVAVLHQIRGVILNDFEVVFEDREGPNSLLRSSPRNDRRRNKIDQDLEPKCLLIELKRVETAGSR